MGVRIKFVSSDKAGFFRFEKLFNSVRDNKVVDLSNISLTRYAAVASALADYSQTNTDCFVFYTSDHRTGLEEIRRIRLHKDFLFAPVIVISDKKTKISLTDYIRHGVQDYFVEADLTQDQLVNTLKNILGKVRIWDNIKVQQRKKNDHLAVVSHDIKGPLTIIKSYMEILLTDPAYELNDLAKTKVIRSQHNAQLALDLVVDILDEFRSKKNMRLNFEKINGRDLLEGIINNLSFADNDKNIKFFLEIENDFNLFADKKSMLQLFTNLLDNAIKYSKPNTKVKVKVRNYDSPVSKNDMINIVISDEGEGIPASKLESIFTPYKQSKDEDYTKGFGLGLSICRRICQYHMGRIWASNRMPHGTSMNILLPIYKAGNQNKSPETSAMGQSLGFDLKKYRIKERKYILVVDDSRDIRDITKKKLQELGFEVATAKDGLEAFQITKDTHPDLVLLDLNMPVLSGDQYLDQVRKNKSIKSSVLLYSIFKSEAIFISTLKKADGFIEKPLNVKEFVTKTSIYMGWEYSVKDKRRHREQKIDPQVLKALPSVKVKSAKVLIVDDCKDNHEILKYYFYKNNHSFESAYDGQECLDKLQNTDFDLVLLDLNMPGMDGFETAQKIAESQNIKKVPVVAFSADEISFKDEDSSHFAGFLKKPLSPVDLNKVVNNLCF